MTSVKVHSYLTMIHVPKKRLPYIYVPSTSDNKLVSSGPLPKGPVLASVFSAHWNFRIGINSSLYKLGMFQDKIRNTCIVEQLCLVCKCLAVINTCRYKHLQQ